MTPLLWEQIDYVSSSDSQVLMTPYFKVFEQNIKQPFLFNKEDIEIWKEILKQSWLFVGISHLTEKSRSWG